MDFGMLGELFDVLLEPEKHSRYAKNNIIGKTKVNGIMVSTVNTLDLGFETALLDKNGAHPVERYCDRTKAEQGHKKWIKKSKTIKKVVKLGYPGLQEDKEITLVK